MLRQCPQLSIVGQPQNLAVAGRGNREAVFVMLGVERAVFNVQPQWNLALLQRLAVIAAQEGNQQLAFEQRVGRIPLNVEELRVGAAAAPFEHIQPPGITGATHRHVVGDDIEDQPHALGAQCIDQTVQGGLAAQFGIDARWVDDVITVHRAGASG